MEEISTKTVTRGFAQADEIILEITSTTRLIFRPQVHDGGVRGVFIRQKKGRGEEWQDTQSINFNTLKSGDGVKLELGTQELKTLFQKLEALYEISAKGVESGEHKYVVAKEEEVIVTEQSKVAVINQLLSKGYSEDFWKTLVEENPDLATKLSFAQIYSQRQLVLREFEHSLEEEKPESYWQVFFQTNDWIFGYGLNYRFLHAVSTQPNYGGTVVTGRGGQRGDFLMNTDGNCKFTVLVEIKKPESGLLGDEEYRNGAWKIGTELANGVAQLQTNCMTWEVEGARTDGNRDLLEDDGVYTHRPKGILVIGNLSQLDNRNKRNTFEGFRRNLINPEVVTFDELLERAKFIMEHGNESVTEPEFEVTNVVENIEDEIDFTDLPF